MLATFINAVLVILGGLLGTIFSNRISEKYTGNIITAMAIVTMLIGVQSTMGTSSILLVIVCLVLGTLIGTALSIDDRLSNSGEWVKKKLAHTPLGKGQVSDAFVTASMLFCVGTMTIIGSIQAGLNHDYEIILTKSIMDFVSATAFAAAMGAGVILSAVTVIVVQGSITLLAGVLAPFLTPQVVTEMSAVGGPIFIGMAINMLGLRKEKVKVGDMIPAIFLPILYFPLAEWIGKFI